MLNHSIEVNPEKLSGVPVFTGTRVPIQNLFDYIDGGDPIEDFLEGFPPVTLEQVISVLAPFYEQPKNSLPLRR